MPGKPENEKSGMFLSTKSWNPFVGCKFGCVYCGPSFQHQLKRRGKDAPFCGDKCYRYVPHTHEERLEKIPSADTVFVAADGDISFCSPEYTRRIIRRIKERNLRFPKKEKTYLFQSKRPKYFEQFLKEFPENVILQTTLETNRDEGYEKWSKAPKPSVRYKDFLAIKYPRKVVTIEPIMDFDLDVFRDWIVSIKPEYVWLGFNSKPNARVLKEKDFASWEPPEDKVQQLIYALENAKTDVYKHNERTRKLRGGTDVYKHNERARKSRRGIEVKGKKLRSVKTHSMTGKRKVKRKG